jgi:hypothetical protein
MSRTVLVLVGFALALAPALAGCLGNNDATPTPPVANTTAAMNATWFLGALNHDKDHDHHDIVAHQNLSTPNFKLIGHDFLLTDAYQGKPAFGYGCGGIATRADGHRFVVVNGFQNDLTFVLVDVTDPSAPQKVGEFYAKDLGSYDADITPDGKYVVLAFDGLYRIPGSGPGLATPRIGFRSACGDQTMALPDVAVTNGIVLIDIHDPAKPTYADFDPSPGFNLHSVSTASVDNVTWIVGSELGIAHGASYFVFDNIQDTPLGPKLVRIANFDSPPATKGEGTSVGITNGHTDVVMAKHPVTKKTLAYVADWEGGVLTLDFTVPQAPVLIGMWTPPGSDPTSDLTNAPPNGFFDSGPCYHNAVHEVLPAEDAWDGKHIIFAGQECPMKVDLKTPGGQVFVIDDTDPAAPKTIGEWHLPGDTGVWTVEYQASPHYLALHNRTLFISDYHAGVWAADVSTAELLKSPPSIGVYLPAMTPLFAPANPDKNFGSPMDEQVDVFPDGTIVINEDTTGLYVVQFDESNPAPPAPGYKYG